jgi:ribosomal protein S18 acetylase RimI-like enzyme
MELWILQWKAYVPAAVKVRLPVAPDAIVPVSHEDWLSSVTVWLAGPLLVQVIVSPTFAVTVDGSNSKSLIAAVTEPAVVATAQGAAPPAAAVEPPPAAAVEPLPLLLQAASATMAMAPTAIRAILCMRLLQIGRGATGMCAVRMYVGSARMVRGVPALPRDPAFGDRLLLHEARAQQTTGRELRDLGDGWLFHDPADREPFWNRLIAPRWPEARAAFDRRLDEVVTLFATLDRLVHIRPSPLERRPPDLNARLRAAGFDVVGSDRRMVLVDRDACTRIAAQWQARHPGRIRIDHHPDRSLASRGTWAVDAAMVLGEAFGVDPFRRVALETDILACAARRACSILLVREDGEPVALARRATVGGGSYLSSIGTRPRWRRRGYAALVTALAVVGAIEAGSDLVHLAVDVENDGARRLYERLGFAVVGDPVPYLLLR